MANTKAGGLKVRESILKRYGPDYYKIQGAKGGKKSRGGGFASEAVGKDGLTGKERASLAGKVGGKAPKKRREASA